MTRTEIKAAAKEQLGGKLFGSKWMMALLVCLIVTAVEGAATSILPGIGTVLLMGPVTMGASYLFLKQARDMREMELDGLLYGFKNDAGETILLGLMTFIFTALWTLLLVIPGIIKGYSYSMAYYIKADHPEYDWKACIDESKAMMDGHKMELFLLDLSFIGWFIVGALCLGVGLFWVAPYVSAARAQFYLSLQK